MLDKSIPLPSIHDADELRQRTAYCHHWMRFSTEGYSEWYCDGRTLRISRALDDEIEAYDLVKDLGYYESFPACIEDWADAIAMRIVDESLLDFSNGERDEVQSAIADSLVLNPSAVRQLIGTSVIETDYFGLLNDGDFEGQLDDYMTE
ncbi:MAG: hypothetical protein K8R36_16760 [Planctomycetales bacterium]|nr:hypothetical protein [Planctomycetales bacterium]